MITAGIILGSLALVAAIVVPLFLEWLKKPRLDIKLGNPSGRMEEMSDGSTRMLWQFVHMRVVNRRLPQPFGRFIQGNTATALTAKLLFWNAPNKQQPLLHNFYARWSSSPEPLQPEIINNKVQYFFDPSKVPLGEKANIVSGDEDSIAVAIKHQGEIECYAFNNWSYQFPGWRNPSWKLESGEYIIEVDINCGNLSVSKEFLLQNIGTVLKLGQKDFVLRENS